MKRLSLFLIFIFPLLVFGQQKRAITVDDLWAMQRINSFDVNSGGNMIVFSATSYSFEKNKGNSDIFIINTDGTGLKAVKNSEVNESEPQFTPDGKSISFIKSGQLFTCGLNGEDEKQITDFYPGVSGAEWAPGSENFIFASSVYPGCSTPECDKEKDEEAENSTVKAEIFDELMIRHWNVWRGKKRSHLFTCNANTKVIKDLYPEVTNEIPPLALGSSNDYSFSHDGDEVAFTSNSDKVEAVSTNNEVYILKLNGQDEKPVKISVSEGNDNQPVYSPDGRFIAFCSMKRAGFEADKQNIVLYDRKSGKLENITDGIDFSAGEIIWSPDSKYIYFTTAHEINNSIFKINIETKKTEIVVEERINSEIKFSADGKTLYFLQQRSTQPDEIFSLYLESNETKQITGMNADKIADLKMNEVETFWTTGAEGAKVQSILVKPPFFDETKKYPMIFLIHGGPQGHWENDFHYRWNLQMFAARGYVVVATNPRGSTGYGQKFTDQISLDWGGKVYTDLMNSYDYAVNSFGFIDSSRTFAAGASYGGYMINWIEGHTNRFKALVCHDGVFNLESMFGGTEELWFPIWEYGGTYWENPSVYKKWSPHNYVKNFKTPMLVVHGANDFRVPEGQAFELFTALQLMKVESRFLYFPDEYHFVVKPQNAKLWWNTIYDWYDKFRQEK